MSQIIPLGIGSPAGLTQLTLTGLSAGAVPPSPSIESTVQRSLSPGIDAYSFQSYPATIYTPGQSFALPVRPTRQAIQIIYGSTPAKAELLLQVSNDGIHWFSEVFDSTSNSIQNRFYANRFMRAAIGDMTPGIEVTVIFKISYRNLKLT